MKRPKSDYVIQTVTNALRLLEQFVHEEALGVTELSKRLDLHKNNVFRLLATLEDRGYVEQCPGSDLYRLGGRCVDLAASLPRNRSLARHGRAAVAALARETGESAHLAALRGFEVVHLDGEQPDRMVVTALRVGRRLAAHCTALGKALLAGADDALREEYDRAVLARGGLPAATAATITDREKFLDHLGSVASQGYALDWEECEPDLCCVAAPVVDAAGRTVAALSISAPTARMDEEVLLTRVAPRVQERALRLSRDLGHH